jgi:hypothetical protein
MSKAKVAEPEAKVAEPEAKAIEPEAKAEGYVLTRKGEKAARKAGNFVKSMDDILLRVMMKFPDEPLTKGSLSDDLWQTASKVLVKLEEEGLVEEAEAGIEVSKPRVVIEDAARPEKLRLEGQAKPKLQKPTKNVYTDRKGERLQRKKHKGWKPVKY